MQREVRRPLGGFGLGEVGARRGPGLMRYGVEEKGGAQARDSLLQLERQNQGQEGEKRFCEYQRCAARKDKGRGREEGRPSEKREGVSRYGEKRVSWNPGSGEQEEGSKKGEGERTE